MDEIEMAGDSEGNVYELGFLLVPSITEAGLAEAFGSVKELILSKGAVAISEEFPKLLTLAYTMEKTLNNKIERFTEGYFGWIKFEMEGSEAQALESTLRLREDVIRHLLIKTVRENTIASKRAFGIRRRPGSKDEVKEKGTAPEMSKEQIDREIEALVDDKTTVA
jgi:ribosomal protein S6